MQRSTAKRRIVSHAPTAAIVLSQSTQRDQESRFGFLLVAFMRLVAAVWIVEGLMQWSAVLMTNADGRSQLALMPPPAIVAVVFFAVINLIASVGLWMATPWGGAIWLVTAGAQLLVLVALPGFFDHPVFTAMLNLALVAAYLVLTWLVASARDRVAQGS